MSKRPSTSTRPPSHKVVWSDRALADLDVVHDFLAAVAPRAAADLKQRLIEAAQSLEFMPQRNTVEDGIYSERVPKHHTLFYVIAEGTVVISQVHDGRRG